MSLFFWMKLLLRVTMGLTLLLSLVLIIPAYIGVGMGGRIIAFSATVFNRTNVSDVLLIDPTRNKLFILTPNTGGLYHEPVWSPDGTRLMYLSTAGTMLQVVIHTLGDSSPAIIDASDRVYQFSMPIWSPDGNQLAYYELDGDWQRSVILYDIATGATTAYAIDTVVSSFQSLDWSPDGRYLLSVIQRAEDTNYAVIELQNGSIHFGAQDHNILTASWVRDGRIVYRAMGDFRPSIFLLDWQTGETTDISQSNFADTTPHPSPNGEEIAYLSNREGDWAIYIYSLLTEETRRFQDYETWTTELFSWSADSRYITYLDQSGLFEANTQTGERRQLNAEDNYRLSQYFTRVSYRP
jgi:Tol biopolymer transport system component